MIFHIFLVKDGKTRNRKNNYRSGSEQLKNLRLQIRIRNTDRYGTCYLEIDTVPAT